MKNSSGTSSVFTRYDLNIEVAGQKVRKVSEDVLLQKVADCIVAGQEEEIESVLGDVFDVLQEKNPMDVINEVLIPGMKEVGRLWKAGVFFLPQVILSSDTMLAGIALCEKRMGKPFEKKAKVVTHTAEGDIHDIGQAIVNALLNAAGFEVISLGADVAVDTVVDACKFYKPVMVTGTALMTTTMTAFPKIAAKLKQSGLEIPFVCGGGAVSEEFVTSFDFGIWGRDASQGPAMAEDALSGLSWQRMRAKWNG